MIANPDRSDSCNSYLLKPFENLTVLGLFYHKTEDDALRIDWELLAIPKQPQYSRPPPLILRDSTLSLLNNECMRLKASSNGFLLCQLIPDSDSHSDSCDADIQLPYPHHYSVFNPLNQQRVNLPVIHKRRSDSGLVFDCSMQDSPFSPLCFTVVLIDCNTQPNHPGFDIKLFSSDQVHWSEFRLSKLEPLYSLGSSPGVVIDGDQFYWFCDNTNHLLVFDNTQPHLWYVDLPDHYRPHSEGYNYRALSAFEGRLFFGFQNQDNQVIRVFSYYLCDWDFKYVVCLRKLKKRCVAILKGTPLSQVEEDIYFKGFHPNNPEVIFFIFQRKLFSYDVKSLELVVHTPVGKYLTVSSSVCEEMDRHWISCQRPPWLRSLPYTPHE